MPDPTREDDAPLGCRALSVISVNEKGRAAKGLRLKYGLQRDGIRPDLLAVVGLAEYPVPARYRSNVRDVLKVTVVLSVSVARVPRSNELARWVKKVARALAVRPHDAKVIA